MKQYHPVAHLVENGQLAGMIIHEGLKAKPGCKAIGINMHEFNVLVSKGLMQMFVMGENGPIVSYTEEEKQKLLKNGKIQAYMGKDYFDNDVRFDKTDISCKTQKIAISVIGIKVMKNIPMMFCCIYRHSAFSKSDIQKIRKETHASFSRIADNMYGVVVNPYTLLSWLRNYSDGYGANFDNALHDNIIYRKKHIGFRCATYEEIKEIKGLYDSFSLNG